MNCDPKSADDSDYSQSKFSFWGAARWIVAPTICAFAVAWLLQFWGPAPPPKVVALTKAIVGLCLVIPVFVVCCIVLAYTAQVVDPFMSNTHARRSMMVSTAELQLTSTRKRYRELTKRVLRELPSRMFLALTILFLLPFIACIVVGWIFKDHTIAGMTWLTLIFLSPCAYFAVHRIQLIRLCRKHGLICPGCGCTPMKMFHAGSSGRSALSIRRCEQCGNKLYPPADHARVGSPS